MQTVVDALGMIMLILLGIIVILGLVIVIAAECRMINRLRQWQPDELPSSPVALGPFYPRPTLNGRGEGNLYEREWYGHG